MTGDRLPIGPRGDRTPAEADAVATQGLAFVAVTILAAAAAYGLAMSGQLGAALAAALFAAGAGCL